MGGCELDEVGGVGLEGDEFGQRADNGLFHLPGTDLFIRTEELDPRGQFTYAFSVDYGQPSPDPGNPYTVDNGFNVVSELRMPEWPASPHLEPPGDFPGRVDEARDPGERILDLVGDARTELTEGRQLLRLDLSIGRCSNPRMEGAFRAGRESSLQQHFPKRPFGPGSVPLGQHGFEDRAANASSGRPKSESEAHS